MLSGIATGCPAPSLQETSWATFDDARGSVPAWVEQKRSEWSDEKQEPMCSICGVSLKEHAKGDSTLGEAGLVVEVLLNNEACSHAFHRVCIGGWIEGYDADDPNGGENHLQCPICRTPIADAVVAEFIEVDSDFDKEAFDEMIRNRARSKRQKREPR